MHARAAQYFFGHFINEHQRALLVHGNDALAHRAQNGVAFFQQPGDLLRFQPEKDLFYHARKQHRQHDADGQRKRKKQGERPVQPRHVGLNILGHDAHDHSPQLMPLRVEYGPERTQ